MELTKFPTWVVASFVPGDAVAFTEAHGHVDVINRSDVWRQNIPLLEQLPRWRVVPV